LITFGICNNSKYDKNSHLYIEELIKSIENENIPNVEIVCCGDYKNSKFKCIGVDETNNPISVKLNTLIRSANNEILILIRDYMELIPGFWKGFKKFGFDWDLAMCVVANLDFARFRDWCVWLGDDLFPNESWQQNESWTGKEGKIRMGRPYLPNYSYDDISRMYCSGGLFIGQTRFFQQHQFNSKINLGSAEDVEWFDSIRLHNFTYSMNRFSGIHLQKQKDRCLCLEHEHFGSWQYISELLIK